MASSSLMTQNEAWINHLWKFHSKVPSSLLETLYDKYDISRAFALTVTARMIALFDHSGSVVPVYLKHLEYGLCRSLHPFFRRVFEALGVAIIDEAELHRHSVGVRCHMPLGGSRTDSENSRPPRLREGKSAGGPLLPPNLRGNMIVSYAPESNKDWKERYVWVSGDDSILVCSSWLEIKKDDMRPGLLLSDKKCALDMIRAYTGTCRSENLFDNSVL